MWAPRHLRSLRSPTPDVAITPVPLRDRLAKLAAIATVICVGVVLVFASSTQFLMPGPLISAHSAIESCSSCHTKSGTGKLAWLHGLVAGDPIADSKACISCHMMPDTALNAHGASSQVLNASTEKLLKVAAQMRAPRSARAQDNAFPTHGVTEGGLACATCHQEHQGAGFKLAKISNEQCRSCHVVKFDSFDGKHPKLGDYPFARRTRLIYDHEGHFGKHFPEIAKKDPSRPVPETCSTCHDGGADRKFMSVAPFEKTCASCHLDQVTGKERVSGPKGVAFLTLPGLDLKTLKRKKADIGEWPEESEAGLTPFMKVMIGRNDQGRALIRSIDRLNLMDLSKANDTQIRAVASLAWEIKRLYHALISGTASDVLADLGMGPRNAGKPGASVIADLTASLPRDVVMSAHQAWLPNLGAEIAARPAAQGSAASGWITKTTTKSGEVVEAAETTAPIVTASTAAPADASAEKPAPTSAKSAPTSDASPPPKSGDQTDDLLNPTPEELRASAADLARAGRKPTQGGGPAPGNVAAAPTASSSDESSRPSARETAAAATSAPTRPQTRAPMEASIESKVDPESWAEYGGWYRQDHAIFYRPTGHKDKFIRAWLTLTGPMAPKGDKSASSAVFDTLTGKDAQGSCTKCHSVDEVQGGKARIVNFTPATVQSKRNGFTRFAHEPHFGLMEGRNGCLTCHNLEKGRPYLKSYEQGDPHAFVSNFGAVKKETCQGCHTSGMARQDCLTCHKYHVDGVVTPIMETKVPMQ